MDIIQFYLLVAVLLILTIVGCVVFIRNHIVEVVGTLILLIVAYFFGYYAVKAVDFIFVSLEHSHFNPSPPEYGYGANDTFAGWGITSAFLAGMIITFLLGIKYAVIAIVRIVKRKRESDLDR